MRTSLNEIEEIEKFIYKSLPIEEAILFEGKLLIDRELSLKLMLQKKIYKMLGFYHQEELRGIAEQVFVELMENPSKSEFQREIKALFQSNSHD